MIPPVNTRLISLEERVIWHVDRIFTNLPDVAFDLRARLEEDLRFVQAELKDLKVIRKYPSILKGLHFEPTLMADRIIISIQSALKKYEYQLRDLHIRMEWVLEIGKELLGESHLAFTMYHPLEVSSGGDFGVSAIMPSFMTPSFSEGIPDILNAHRASEAYSFRFPISTPPEVEFTLRINKTELSSDDTPGIVTSKHPLFYRDDIVRYYLQWADEVVQQSYRSQHENWVKSTPAPVIDEEEFKGRWQSYRDKLEHHLNATFTKVIAEKSMGETIVAIIFHPPDELNLENDPFLILEFVEVKWSSFVKGRIAKTLETTGRIIDTSKFMPTYSNGQGNPLH